MNEEDEIIARDTLWNLLLCFVALTLFALIYINDPTAAEEHAPRGLIQIETCWRGDIDVDTWARSPGDAPVGYARKDGTVFSLMRDDVGAEGRPDDENCELVIARALPAGAWLVNLHAFSSRVSFPVSVRYRIIMRSNGVTTVLREGAKELRSVGDERTIARFRTDVNGRVVPGSVGDIHEGMRR